MQSQSPSPLTMLGVANYTKHNHLKPTEKSFQQEHNGQESDSRVVEGHRDSGEHGKWLSRVVEPKSSFAR